jgi:hypothetical protein
MFVAPATAYATNEIAVCGQSVTEFFAPLVEKRLIVRKPYRVSALSVNHFKPNLLANMTAYGLPVVGVFGYTDNPLFFEKRGISTQDVYGVVVKEGLANTLAQLDSVGAIDARAFRFDSRRTVILCKGEMHEND